MSSTTEASRRAKLSPRVRARLACLALALFANAYAMSNPFPYAPFMVLSFGLTDERESVGFYAGFVLSVFMLGRLVSSYPLGLLSDRVGRRPVIELGLLSCVVFQLPFGLSPTFGFALTMRFLMGVCNGIIGVSKAWLPELAPADRQPLAMSLVAGMWGVGQVVGPALGGLLVTPGPASPSLLPAAGGARARFPYLMPNVIGAALALVALLAGRRYLPDDRGGGGGGGGSSGDDGGGGGQRHTRERGDVALVPTGAQSSSAAVVADGRDGCSGGGGDGAAVDDVAAPALAGSGEGRAPRRAGCCRLGIPSASVAPLFAYCMLSLTTIVYQEAYPLWCVAPVSAGGLGWDAHHIGGLMSFGGAALALSNFVLFPWMSNYVSSAAIFRVSAAGLVLLYAVLPHLPRDSAASLPLLLLHNALEKSLSSNCFTAVFLLINASCAPAMRGRVNGLGMSVSSGFKAVGPTLGAVCFAWSLTNGVGAPFDVQFTFWLAAFLATLTWLVACCSFASDDATSKRRAARTAAAPEPTRVAPDAVEEERCTAPPRQGKAL